MSIENIISQKIIGAAIEVHKQLGPGLLESAYEQCLAHEFSLQKIGFQRINFHVPLLKHGIYRLVSDLDED